MNRWNRKGRDYKWERKRRLHSNSVKRDGEDKNRVSGKGNDF